MLPRKSRVLGLAEAYGSAGSGTERRIAVFVRRRAPQKDVRHDAHHTRGQALAKQRRVVERCFSRLKGQRSLNHITTRGLGKVTLHCYLSLVAMQASVLFPSK